MYTLAINGDQNYVSSSNFANLLRVQDTRSDVPKPNTYATHTITAFFNASNGMPDGNWWSGFHVRGWGDGYCTWELVGPSSTNNTNNRLYYRDGKNSSWATDWKGIAFLSDVSNVADAYFNGQNIYNDYGHWVVGLVRIGTADIGDKYISGEMIYRRSNGIYGNGSVRFNLIKKYNSTNVFAGVFYNGYGIDPDQDAPRLCTFTYQGVKWGGLCWRSAASLNSIKTIIYDNSSTDTPFYVLYYKSNIPDVTNPEINNSISVLGSDIDVQPVSTNGRIYTSADRLEINNITNGWSYTRYRSNGRYVDTGLSGTTGGLCGLVGNYEIRPTGSNNEGIFVRYSQSDYGKLGVVNRSGQQASIGYFNSNTGFGDKPIWTVGAGLRDSRSFDWWYGTEGYKMTLMEDGRLFVNRRQGDAPSYSLSIGDNDTGLNWYSDGTIEFMSNSKQAGFWGYNDGRLYGCIFREPTGHTYQTVSLMVNGSSSIAPAIAFHQPGITASLLLLNSNGDFNFRNIDNSGYKNIYAGNLIADAGYLYSRYNGIEIKIGSENDSYVHFITKPARSLYFANSLFVNGSILPYVTNAHDLGDAGHIWRNAYIGKVIGGANWADYTTPNYNGGQQANPQTYFGSGIGLKVAMTGVYTNGSYWSDTLWVNGYYGGDVLKCTALHFPRDGSGEMYISAQNSTATAYGTTYRIWSAINSNKLDSPWSCSTLNASGRILTASDIYSQSWVRTVGQTGWYSETYGGGVYMTDSTWVRIYNNKQFLVTSGSADSIHTYGGVNASGRIYGGGILTSGGGLDVVGVRASTGCSSFNVYGRFYGNADHGGIEIGASDNVLGIGVHKNDAWYMWWTPQGSVDSTSLKSYIFEWGANNWRFTGNILASGGITAKTTSDMRLKNKIGKTNYSDKLMSLGFVFDYVYNNIARSREGKMIDNEKHIGLSYQNVSKVFPVICGKDNDGYGYINYISPDLISLSIGAIQEIILEERKIKEDIIILKSKVHYLESENILLKKRLGLIP